MGNKLIVRADDCGISKGVNFGIYTAVKDGFIQAVGIMVNQKDTQHGYELIKEFQHLSIGLHCNIVLGKPLCKAELVESLLDGKGYFKSSKYYRATKEDCIVYEEVCLEIQEQINEFKKLTGKLPDYVDYHAACTPTFAKAIKDVCQKNHFLYIPFPSGKVAGEEVHYCELSSKDEFGVNPVEFYERNKDVILNHDIAIAVFHPGYVDARIMEVSSLSLQRAIDLTFVTSKACSLWLQEHGVELTNFDIYSELFDR